ncbi:glycosyltransferase family 1 protein [Martelella alba]|uniref:Glycosyltransferase family 1 protein n=1 Tax=Martelella alba TaxID=2590451 RepID=A0A506U3R1_9HYPH|nr:glycosyltransferase [Martelella alba]TPW28088.1 glycosyltransferase family 1 protein [Martelella alba]
MRVLIVGYFDRKHLFRNYYSVDSKLANGFIRAGHNALCFSDRDHAREATPFNTQKLGKTKMRDKLVEAAGHYRPHLIVFGHCDLIDGATYQRLRDRLAGVRMAAFNLDPIFRPKTMGDFAERAAHMDAAFITTADRKALAELGLPKGRTFFMPNPADSGIETARVFDIPREDLKFDGQFLGTGIEKREEQLDHIIAHLSKDYRFNAGGRSFNSERLTSTPFLDALAEGAVSPNLPLDDTDPAKTPYLYSSDRLGQLLGQGITTLTFAASRHSDLYEDGVMEYKDRDHLVALMEELRHDDVKRRLIGEKGYRIALERTSSTKVAEYILDATFGNDTSGYAWNTSPV